MKIRQSKRGKGAKFGARKYSEINSFTGGSQYQVVKIRIKNTRNYAYKCTCPDHLFRQRNCKHIRLMIETERNESRG